MTDTAEVTEPVKKTRKPRSPNKPKTPEKLAYLASKKIDRFNEQEDEAVAGAIAKVQQKFRDKVAEFLSTLPAEVIQNVTGVRTADYYLKDSEATVENPDVSENE